MNSTLKSRRNTILNTERFTSEIRRNLFRENCVWSSERILFGVSRKIYPKFRENSSRTFSKALGELRLKLWDSFSCERILFKNPREFLEKSYLKILRDLLLESQKNSVSNSIRIPTEILGEFRLKLWGNHVWSSVWNSEKISSEILREFWLQFRLKFKENSVWKSRRIRCGRSIF